MHETVAASPRLFGYGGALVLVLAAAWITLSVEPVRDQALFLIFFPVVVASAALAGSRAGLLATALSAVAAYLVLPLGDADGASSAEVLPLVLLFLAGGWLTSRLAGSLHGSRVDADRQRMAANEFAATLHLRLMLAEKEIDRLQQALAADEPETGAHEGRVPFDSPRAVDGLRGPDDPNVVSRSRAPRDESGGASLTPLPLPPLWTGVDREPN